MNYEVKEQLYEGKAKQVFRYQRSRDRHGPL